MIALISTLLGLLGGSLPRLLTMLEDGQRHRREMEALRMQAQMQIEVAKHTSDNRLREIETQADVRMDETWSERMTALAKASITPTGNTFVDTFNGLLRPTFASAIMLVFMFASALLIYSVMADYAAGTIKGDEASKIIFGSLIGASIEGVLGFLFGQRSASKMTNRTS